jgi:hypothetical protein
LNATGNPDAGEEWTMSKTEVGGSGSPDCSLTFSAFEPLTVTGEETAFAEEKGITYALGRRWVVKSISISGKKRVRVEGIPRDSELIKIASVLCPDVDFWDVEPDLGIRLFRSVVER